MSLVLLLFVLIWRHIRRDTGKNKKKRDIEGKTKQEQVLLVILETSAATQSLLPSLVQVLKTVNYETSQGRRGPLLRDTKRWNLSDFLRGSVFSVTEDVQGSVG